MVEERVKCTECDNMILPSTSDRNQGLCAPCSKMSASFRQELREFRISVASGSVFVPNDEELRSAVQPEEFAKPSAVWSLEPHYYEEQSIHSPQEALSLARTKPEGNVFLVSKTGSQLNLSFGRMYGVCEYVGENNWHYAHTSENLSNQVSKEEHVGQACPCCGVGLHWYPSRFHLPREHAMEIVESVLSSEIPKNVDWLSIGDITFTSRGNG